MRRYLSNLLWYTLVDWGAKSGFFLSTLTLNILSFSAVVFLYSGGVGYYSWASVLDVLRRKFLPVLICIQRDTESLAVHGLIL